MSIPPAFSPPVFPPQSIPRVHKKRPSRSGRGAPKYRLFLDDFCHGGVFAYALDAVFAALLGLVAFAGGDDLAVGGLEVEAELAGPVDVHFKFRALFGGEAFGGLVFQRGDGGVPAHAVDGVLAGSGGGLDLGGGEDLPVAGLEDEHAAGIDLLDDECAHGKDPRSFIHTYYTVTFAFLKVKCPFRGSLGGDADIFVLRGGACPRAARI